MSNSTSNQTKPVGDTKRDKRLESKKKKAMALLRLIETRTENSTEKSQTMEADLNHDDSVDEPQAKVSRIEEGTNTKSWRALPDGTSIIRTAEEAVHSQSGSRTSDEEYSRAKQVQRALQKSHEENLTRNRAKALKYAPKIHLTLENLLPFDIWDDDARRRLESRLPPLFVMDLQHVLLLALLRNFTFWTPRWCRVMRPRKLSSVVLVVLKDVCINDFEDNADSFPFLKNSFLKHVEMVCPAQYGSSVERDLSTVPLLISQLKRYSNRKDIRERIFKLISRPDQSSDMDGIKTDGCKDTDDGVRADSCKDTYDGVWADSCKDTDHGVQEDSCKYYDHGVQANNCKDTDHGVQADGLLASGGKVKSSVQRITQETCAEEDQFPRTSLLLSTLQQMEEGYPLPVLIKNDLYKDYVFSKENYVSTTASSPLFALDCEMCQTIEKKFELTRVSIVNEQREVIYDQLVKPYNPITDYLTQFSGMTEELLSSVTKRVEDVHKDIRELLPPDAILCGQSLWNDLKALKMFHPYVIDTSVIFNQSGDRKIRCGLRKLAFNFLGRQIQASKMGHCSIEDAKAAMDLVKLKLSKSIEFGDAMLGGVYFPDIKTYFRNPSKAQNVEETFSASPSSMISDNGTLRPLGVSLHPQSSCEKMARNCKPCVQRTDENSEDNMLHGRSGPPGNAGMENTADLQTAGDSVVLTSEEGRNPVSNECEGGRDSQHQPGESVNQQRVFFQQEGSTVMCSFFELLADNKIPAGVVGSEEFVSRFQSQPRLECLVADSDSDACGKAVSISKEKDFSWVELTSFVSSDDKCLADLHSQNEKKKHLCCQLDNQVQEMVTKLQERTLVTVIMTGRHNQGQHLNAATFLKVT